jgi:hypothetical protein
MVDCTEVRRERRILRGVVEYARELKAECGALTPDDFKFGVVGWAQFPDATLSTFLVLAMSPPSGSCGIPDYSWARFGFCGVK